MSAVVMVNNQIAGFNPRKGLQDLLNGWVLDEREMRWLWLKLKELAIEQDRLGDYKTVGMDGDLCSMVFNNQHFIPLLLEQKAKGFLSLSSFERVQDEEQISYMLNCFLPKVLHFKPFYNQTTLLEKFTPRDRLITAFDFWPVDLPTKLSELNALQACWVDKQSFEKKLSWYGSGGAEKKKCQIAWQWYQDNHPLQSAYTSEFSKAEDVFQFLEGTVFDKEQKLYHLEEIKKKFKNFETSANRKGAQQTNLVLSIETKNKLNELVKIKRSSMKQVVSDLINKEYDSLKQK